jgi:hypothetical protein
VAVVQRRDRIGIPLRQFQDQQADGRVLRLRHGEQVGLGDAVPAAGGAEMSTTAYYRDDVRNAEAQFDHQETTLSHLLRVPHPALAGRTYGQALADAVLAGGLRDGRVRVLMAVLAAPGGAPPGNRY